VAKLAQAHVRPGQLPMGHVSTVTSTLPEIALVLVRLSHVARVVVSTDHTIV